MIRALARTLIRRTPRERVLLGLMALVVLPFAFAALIILPLQDRRTAQAAQQVEARALLEWLTEQARNYVPPPATGDAAPERAGPEGGDAAPQSPSLPAITSAAELEASLQDARLRSAATRLSVQGQGTNVGARMTLGFDSVPFEAAMTWAASLPTRGVHIRALRVQRIAEAPGQIRLELTLEPQS